MAKRERGEVRVRLMIDAIVRRVARCAMFWLRVWFSESVRGRGFRRVRYIIRDFTPGTTPFYPESFIILLLFLIKQQ